MNQIRHYCNLHFQEIFDVEIVNRVKFYTVAPNTFRKYVSRLVEEHALTPVSKGVYYIGPSLPEDIGEIVFQQYFDSYGSRYAKETLLHKLGIIKNEPKTITFYKGWNRGNRNIYNLRIIQTDIPDPIYNGIAEILELLDCEKIVGSEDKPEYVTKLYEKLIKAKSFQFNKSLARLYSRIVFSKLAYFLDQLHISNKVMQDYEDYIKATD